MIHRENEIKPATITADIADDKLYDLSILEEMDDTEYIIEMVSMFLNDTPGDIKEIKEALAAGKTEVVYKKAHKLKSSAGILQADNFINLLAGIERVAKAGATSGELASLVEEAQHQYKKLETALEKLLKNIKS